MIGEMTQDDVQDLISMATTSPEDAMADTEGQGTLGWFETAHACWSEVWPHVQAEVDELLMFETASIKRLAEIDHQAKLEGAVELAILERRAELLDEILDFFEPEVDEAIEQRMAARRSQ